MKPRKRTQSRAVFAGLPTWQTRGRAHVADPAARAVADSIRQRLAAIAQLPRDHDMWRSPSGTLLTRVSLDVAELVRSILPFTAHGITLIDVTLKWRGRLVGHFIYQGGLVEIQTHGPGSAHAHKRMVKVFIGGNTAAVFRGRLRRARAARLLDAITACAEVVWAALREDTGALEALPNDVRPYVERALQRHEMTVAARESPRTKSEIPHITHEGAIEQAIGMFLGYPEWYEIPQKARDRIWGSLRWLVDQTHGVESPAPFGNVNDDPTAPRLCVPPSDEKA